MYNSVTSELTELENGGDCKSLVSDLRGSIPLARSRSRENGDLLLFNLALTSH